MTRPLLLIVAIAALFQGRALADAAPQACVASGGGRLQMQITGAFEADIDWHNDGTVCDGMPRPRGDALRLMFSRDDEGLLIVLGITGLERGATADGLLANLTLVRQGVGEFYGTLGANACLVEVSENRLEPGETELYRISGQGRCEHPVGAIGRPGEIRVTPFSFTGRAHWPEQY